MDSLLKCLRTYFKLLKSHPTRWEEWMKKANGHLTALNNLTEQLQLIQKVKDNSIELLKLPEFRERLLTKIYSAIEVEVSALKTIIEECSSANQELKAKLIMVEQSNEKVDWCEEGTELSQGSPTQPAVNVLLEWADDAWKYYYSLYLGMSNSFECLAYEDKQSVATFQESFKEDVELAAHIQKMLSYTQFFILES